MSTICTQCLRQDDICLYIKQDGHHLHTIYISNKMATSYSSIYSSSKLAAICNSIYTSNKMATICSSIYSSEMSSNMAAILDQKNYLEELNRHLT